MARRRLGIGMVVGVLLLWPALCYADGATDGAWTFLQTISLLVAIPLVLAEISVTTDHVRRRRRGSRIAAIGVSALNIVVPSVLWAATGVGELGFFEMPLAPFTILLLIAVAGLGVAAALPPIDRGRARGSRRGDTRS
jgi:hypothetical protein